jgi:hypothetical protein
MPWSDGDCCDCGKYPGELFMLRPKLWKSPGLTPTDCICIACLSEKAGKTGHVFGLYAAAAVQRRDQGGPGCERSVADKTATAMRKTGEARRSPYFSIRRSACCRAQTTESPKGDPGGGSSTTPNWWPHASRRRQPGTVLPLGVVVEPVAPTCANGGQSWRANCQQHGLVFCGGIPLAHYASSQRKARKSLILW